MSRRCLGVCVLVEYGGFCGRLEGDLAVQAFLLLRLVFMMHNNNRNVSHWLHGKVRRPEAQQELDI